MQKANQAFKGKIAPIDEWTTNTADIGSHVYDATLLGEVISKSFKKNQNARCFNCGKQGHLKTQTKHTQKQYFFKRQCKKEAPASAKDVVKAGFGVMNTDQQGTGKVILCH